MREYLRQTQEERRGAIDGVSLFFGALLGANLGTVEQLPLHDYIQLIVLLAGTVMVLRTVSTSERRGYALLTLALYVVVVGAYLGLPSMRPEGLSDAATARLAATLAIWMIAVLMLEFWPTLQAGVRPPAAAGEAEAPPPR